MSIMEKDKVFLDSSVLITATLSSRGGSFYILNNLKNKFEFQINEYVLKETLEILAQKFSTKKELKNKLFLLLGWTPIKILPFPSKREIKNLEKVINKEDAPILTSAIENGDYLLTLDNDFLTKNVVEFSKKKGLIILKPKEFIEKHR